MNMSCLLSEIDLQVLMQWLYNILKGVHSVTNPKRKVVKVYCTKKLSHSWLWVQLFLNS